MPIPIVSPNSLKPLTVDFIKFLPISRNDGAPSEASVSNVARVQRHLV